MKEGDPSYAGALAGIALGIPSYHLLELKSEIPVPDWQECMAMKELEIPEDIVGEIRRTLQQIRDSGQGV